MTYKVGDRVRLVSIDDAYTRLRPGSTGTVDYVDDLGTVHIAWDNGVRLGVVEEAGDAIELLEEL